MSLIYQVFLQIFIAFLTMFEIFLTKWVKKE